MTDQAGEIQPPPEVCPSCGFTGRQANVWRGGVLVESCRAEWHHATALAYWCRCGHKKATHVGPHRCGGLAPIGPGGEHDGGDFAACRCTGFEPLRAAHPGSHTQVTPSPESDPA